MELLGWLSKDDLFGDEGAIKTSLKEGSGWKTPNDSSEVLVSLRAKARDVTYIYIICFIILHIVLYITKGSFSSLSSITALAVFFSRGGRGLSAAKVCF